MPYRAFVLLIALFASAIGHSQTRSEKVFLMENFESLQDWEPLIFPKIKKHSVYTISTDTRGSSVRAESSGSASGLKYRKTFNVYAYPNIRWRWKAENVYEKGSVKTREGDDYPIRVYIIFKYDPEKADFFTRLKYGSAKLFQGEYPPHSALNYIWANKTYGQTIFPSPFADDSKMIIKQGPSDVGNWHEEKVNLLEDYREAFGEDPPENAGIVIMNDSDNTGESSVSYFDFIEVYR